MPMARWGFRKFCAWRCKSPPAWPRPTHKDLVHRDIKPANILLEDGVERVKITDFGLARAADDASLTRTGVIAGTPQFMSPEQARGELVDHRSDLFSLGSVLYAMCTGRPPFRAETSYGMLRRICEGQPRDIRDVNPEIPEWLAAFVSRLHAKDPADRFQTAGEVAQLLEQCLANLRQPEAAPFPAAVSQLALLKYSVPPTRRTAESSRRTPRLVRRTLLQLSQVPVGSIVLGVASVTALTIGLIGLFNRSNPQAVPPARAQPQIHGTIQFAIEQPGEPPAAQARPEIVLPNWDDDTARQIFDLKAEIERLENRVSELETQAPINPSLPPGEGRGEGDDSQDANNNTSPTKQEK